ncbi:MAG: hypothetical protein ABSB12_00980 [Candidatus Saccharimonadales bacterium]|jgi:pimeloyl-ACP methyl ester carboxylesterase
MLRDIGHWETVDWQPVIGNGRENIPIQCLVSNEALAPDSEPVYIFGGYSEEKFALRAAVKSLNELRRASIAVNLPDGNIKNRDSLELVAKEAPLAVAQWFNERADRVSDAKIDVIAHSKGAGALLVAGNEAPERFGAFGLIGPIGITNELLGSTPNERIRNYLWRITVLNNIKQDHNPLSDPSNLISFYEFAARISKDLLAHRLKSKLELALSLDLAQSVGQLSQNHPVRVFLGVNDRLFTVEEYRKSLGEASFNINTEQIPGSHSALVSRMGRYQLELASNWLEAVRLKRN